ncbi:hypothetical protein BDV06DRAFT_195813 [Aspergillus oleicola]
MNSAQMDKIKGLDATIVDFYRRNERLGFLWRSRNLSDVIYRPLREGGPETITDEARRKLEDIGPENYRSHELDMR